MSNNLCFILFSIRARNKTCQTVDFKTMFFDDEQVF